MRLNTRETLLVVRSLEMLKMLTLEYDYGDNVKLNKAIDETLKRFRRSLKVLARLELGK